MATATVTKIAYNLKLNNGTGPTGNVKTVNVSLGDINPTTATDGNALSLCALITPCLIKSLYNFQKVVYSDIEGE